MTSAFQFSRHSCDFVYLATPSTRHTACRAALARHHLYLIHDVLVVLLFLFFCDRLAELELVQRRLDALDSSNLQLQEVADSLGARRDELNDAITRIETEGREFARAAQEEIDGDGTGSNNPGLVEELKELVQRREQCERIIASLDHHRQSSVLAAKIIASHPDSGTLAAIAAATGEDSGGNGQLESKRSSLIASVGGDRGVIVVAGGQKELLLQEADDHRRWYAQEQHRRGLQLNEISYSMDLCTAKDREAQRQLAELEKTAAAVSCVGNI